MEMTFFKMLFITSVWGLSAKHVFVRQSMSWPNAQAYCRNYFTDLSSISSERDNEKFRETVAENSNTGWIGLYREGSSSIAWKWSGGGYATFLYWGEGEPDYGSYGIWSPKGWYDSYTYSSSYFSYYYYFFCFNLIVVEETKTWEEALQHCKEHHSELTSLVSETELLLAQREISEAQSTDHVWIGLRYLGDGWLWVNGDPVEYEAWPRGGDQDHRCPNSTHFCGALSKEGLWQSWDCQEKLNFICY